MTGPLDLLNDDARDRLVDAEVPDRVDPMLATLVDDAFSDPNWIFERKLDGERALAYRDGGSVRLVSRNERELADTYPEIAEALEEVGPDRFVADGEVVAFEGDLTSFSRLQQRMGIEDREEARGSDVAVWFYLFDLVHLDGKDTRGLRLRDRKLLLREAVAFEDPIRFTAHRNEAGEEMYEEACSRGWEGVIAKDATSEYAGSRSRSWQKFKCVSRQELVVGGFTEPEGERIGFGALLVGHYDGDDLVYAGKVGTGYDDDTLESLSDRLSGIERATTPFDAGDPPDDDEIHWVSPRLVAEIGFTEWTEAGRLRHPRYIGLRRDKEPEDVVREAPS